MKLSIGGHPAPFVCLDFLAVPRGDSDVTVKELAFQVGRLGLHTPTTFVLRSEHLYQGCTNRELSYAKYWCHRMMGMCLHEGSLELGTAVDILIEHLNAFDIQYIYVHGADKYEHAHYLIQPRLNERGCTAKLIDATTLGCPALGELEPQWVACPNHGQGRQINKTWFCASLNVRKLVKWVETH